MTLECCIYSVRTLSKRRKREDGNSFFFRGLSERARAHLPFPFLSLPADGRRGGFLLFQLALKKGTILSPGMTRRERGASAQGGGGSGGMQEGGGAADRLRTAAAATTSTPADPGRRRSSRRCCRSAPATRTSAASKLWYLWTYAAQAMLVPFLNLAFLRGAGLTRAQLGAVSAARPWLSAVSFLLLLFPPIFSCFARAREREREREGEEL